MSDQKNKSCPRWQQFLKEVFGNPEKVEKFQRFLGWHLMHKKAKADPES